MVLIIFGLWAIAGILLIPSLVLFLECVLASFAPQQFPPRRTGSPVATDPAIAPDTPRVTILVPAHNEASEIQLTLAALRPELKPQDRLVVIADNCSDNTAAIARDAGAEVLERQNAEQRGKGYALDFGLRSLDDDPPEIVVMVDADCNVVPGTIQNIAQQAAITDRPVQSLYLMEQPKQPSPKDSISALAFLVKNRVRPRGMAQLGLPCLLTGTGMAFPWDLIRNSPLASGNIVEDMQLGLDLAIAGQPALFCESAQVFGRLPQNPDAATSQRTRWEHGHLQTLRTQVPRLLTAAIAQFRGDLLALGLDLAIPPLSLLVMLWGASFVLVAGVTALLPISWGPALLLGVEGLMILVAIALAWARFGRQVISLSTLLSIPLYILWKIPMYVGFLGKPQTQWIRTKRDNEAG